MQTPIRLAGLVLLALAATTFLPGEVLAESPVGWSNSHPAYQFSYINPAGNRILFSFHDAWHPATGRSGIVVTTHRIRDDGFHVGIDIKAIPAAELKEFWSQANLVYRKLEIRGFWDEIEEFADNVLDGISDGAEWVTDRAERVVAVVLAMKNVARELKELVEAILDVGDKFTAIFTSKAVDEGNKEAVVRYAVNVKDAGILNASLAFKAGWTMDRTLEQEPNRAKRRELTRALVQTIGEL